MKKIGMIAMIAGAALAAPALAQSAADRDRAYAAELVADAGTRTSLLQGSGGASYSGGRFQISDGTGINVLNIGGTIQTRYNLNFRDETTAVGGGAGSQNDFTHGFSLPLVRLRAYGNLGIEGLSYKFQGRFSDYAASGNDGFRLEDAFGNYDFGNGFALRWGQFILPFQREVMVAEEHSLGTTYSVTSSYFDQGRSQGIVATYAGDMFRIMGGFSDGFNTANTGYAAANESDYAVTIRAEGQVTGAANWARWDDFTSFRSAPDFGVLIGGAVHFQGAGDGGATTGVTAPNQDVLAWTLDVSLEDAGWNVFAAYVGRSIDVETGTDSDDHGFVVQGGIFVADQWEIFARFDAIIPDDNGLTGPTAPEDNYFLSGGVNHYIVPESHAAKLTFEVGYAFEGAGRIPARAGGLGGVDLTSGRYNYLGDTDDGEFFVAVQSQLVW